LNSGCLFAIDNLGVPVKDALKGLRPVRRRYGESQQVKPEPPKFACPGSLLKMEFDPKHPVAYGMPEEAPGLFYGSTAYEILPSFGEKQSVAVVRYPGENPLMSGYLMGGKYLQKKTAVVDVPFGKGKVILLGFGVQNRAQPHGTFKLLFNSLYYGASQ